MKHRITALLTFLAVLTCTSAAPACAYSAESASSVLAAASDTETEETEETADYTEYEENSMIFHIYADHAVLASYSGTESAVTIPSTVQGIPVTEIGADAFRANMKLCSVTLPATLESIGEQAFRSCVNLSSISIPKSVTAIGAAAFAWTNIRSIVIPDSITEIPSQLCWGCSQLNTVTLPAGTTTIGYAAFDSCYALSTITLPEGLTTIKGHAFYQCKRLSDITIPSSVTTMGSYTFTFCGITSLEIPSGLTEISDYAFSHTNLTEVTIPAHVTVIGTGAFQECSQLTSVRIENPECQIKRGGGFQGASPTISNTVVEDYGDGCYSTPTYYFTGTIYGYTDSTAQTFAEQYGHNFVAIDAPVVDLQISGDINADGAFSVTDVVLLQKWILAAPDVTLTNWEAADFYPDGRLNAIDLCLMKHVLLHGEA